MTLLRRSHIRFRLTQMPCCAALLCWVNPRLPNYCPECGKRCYIQLRTGEHTHEDWEGWLCQEGVNSNG